MVDPREGEELLWKLRENHQYAELFRVYGKTIERGMRYIDRVRQGLIAPVDREPPSLAEYLEFFIAAGELPVADFCKRKACGQRKGTRGLCSDTRCSQRMGKPIAPIIGPMDPLGVIRNGKAVLSADEAMCFLDPEKKIDSIPADRRDFVLARIFHLPALNVLPLDNKYHVDNLRFIHTIRHRSQSREKIFTGLRELNQGLMDVVVGEKEDEVWALRPEEAVLLVNTSRPREQLISEFESFIDSMDVRAANTRKREEAAQHRRVWEMRQHQGMTYSQIGKALGIKKDTVRKSFEVAFFSIHGVSYTSRKASFHAYRVFDKEKIENPCRTCTGEKLAECVRKNEELSKRAEVARANPDLKVMAGSKEALLCEEMRRFADQGSHGASSRVKARYDDLPEHLKAGGMIAPPGESDTVKDPVEEMADNVLKGVV